MFVAALVAASGLAPMSSASATGADVVATCREQIGGVEQLGERACRTAEQLARGFANGCRNLSLNAACNQLDGRRTGSNRVVKYLSTWTHRALQLQRGLGDNVALARQTIPHTHNTSNSSVYTPTVTNQDPNQIYSIAHQLDMDIRAIELDLHWVPSAHGTAGTRGHAVVMCHGSEVGPVHAGCSVDRSFSKGLNELRRWLLRLENSDEVVLLYLENHLVTKLGHDTAADALAAGLGDLVARPPTGKRCAPLPTSTTPAQLRAAGHRVLIVGNCGPGRWGTWVHERGPNANWVESSSGPVDEYPGLRGCAAERKRTGAGRAIVRWYEDSTWVSAMAGGSSSHLTTTEARAMAACGVTLIGFDQLTPEDPRLTAVVWSWAPGAPARPNGAASCAISGSDGRFRDAACGDRHPFACMVSPDSWRVTRGEASWADGPSTCAREFPGSAFGVPANGWENGQLRSAASGRTPWLNYADTVGNGGWRA